MHANTRDFWTTKRNPAELYTILQNWIQSCRTVYNPDVTRSHSKLIFFNCYIITSQVRYCDLEKRLKKICFHLVMMHCDTYLKKYSILLGCHYVECKVTIWWPRENLSSFRPLSSDTTHMTKAAQSTSSTQRFVLITVSTDPVTPSGLHKLYLYRVAPNGKYLQMATEHNNFHILSNSYMFRPRDVTAIHKLHLLGTTCDFLHNSHTSCLLSVSM